MVLLNPPHVSRDLPYDDIRALRALELYNNNLTGWTLAQYIDDPDIRGILLTPPSVFVTVKTQTRLDEMQVANQKVPQLSLQRERDLGCGLLDQCRNLPTCRWSWSRRRQTTQAKGD